MAKKEAPIEEKVYNIPLRSEWIAVGRVARTKKAVSAVKSFISRHTRAQNVMISEELNRTLWSSGAKKPPGKIKVKASIDKTGRAIVRMPGEITLEEEKKRILSKKDEKPDKEGTGQDKKEEKPKEAGAKEDAKPEAVAKEGAEEAREATAGKGPEKEAKPVQEEKK